MFSRKVCTSALVLGLSLGALSELHALPLRGTRGELRIQQDLASRIYQEIANFWHDHVASQHNPGIDEGPGLCPNGRPRQGGTGSSNGNGNGNSNGNG